MSTLQSQFSPSTPPGPTQLSGEVIFIYAFDVGYELRPYPRQELLGQPVREFAIDTSKRTPKQLFFHRPQMVRFPITEKMTDNGLVQFQFSVKLLPVGAISVSVRTPFQVDKIESLADFHEIRFNDGRTIHDLARELAEQVRQEILPYLTRPHSALADEEAYTVFFAHIPKTTPDQPEFDAERFLAKYRRQITAALVEESDESLLSDQECIESTQTWFSYSKNDLTVFDWDAALVIDDPKQFDQTLYIIELTNLQLTELEAYDRILDDVIDRAYADLNSGAMRRWTGRRVQRELRVIRVDLARLFDEMSNLTKVLGDFHAARLYQGLAARFHLSDWQKVIDHKMQTLDDIYQLLASDRMNRWMLILEFTIVFLFIFDILKALISTSLGK